MNAIIYTRHSPRPPRRDGAGQEIACESCETQESYCRDWARMMGHTVLAVYQDKGKSGKSTEGRTGLASAIAHAKREKAGFVAYSLSRWARSTTDAIRIAEDLNKSGCPMVSVKESIDTTNPYGRFTYTIFAALAALEREVISERTSEAMLHHQSVGRRMSDRAPYGWQRDPTSPAMLIPDAAEQVVVGEMVRLSQDGLGYREIARRLTAAGYRNRVGRAFHHDLISTVLCRINP